MTALTIGITTRDRPESLRRCLRSIATVLGAVHDVVVFDDASDVPVAEQLAGEDHGVAVRIVRDERRVGYIAGRNLMVQQARHEFVLLLDDDTMLLDAAAVRSAIGVLTQDRNVAAVAFAQAEADGRPWPEGMQPASGFEPRYVASFIGFAHLLRRRVFLASGGYRENFVFYGEEKDYCLRLLSAGHRVVYLPNALIAHIPDPRGRAQGRYVRYVIRNDFLHSLYNEPWLMVAAGVPIRLHRYRRMAAGISAGDPGGLAWILGEIRRSLPAVWRDRKPVSWATVRTWRTLRDVPQRYRGPS